MQVSVIIPVYNALALAKQCLKSVYEHGAQISFEVILVDNGSAGDVQVWGEAEQKGRANLHYLRYEEPLGFARSVNVGVAASTGEVLIVLNSDTLVTAGWMDELYRLLMADPSLGAITPITNHAGEPAQMDFGTVDLPVTKALVAFAKRQRAPHVFYLPQRLTFFCVAVRREVWLSFNGLDEMYRVGNFEDDDLCLRLRVAGYRLGVAQHVFVYHHNNATFSANKISHGGWMTKNAATFAGRAREFGEASYPAKEPPNRWPKRAGQEVSVVVLPSAGGSMERTLRSLSNQTIVDFEVVLPDSVKAPTRSWVAYITQGDVLYPFHLEALLDAMERNGAEAIFADGWIAGASAPVAHPDATKQIRKAPLLLSGWMHHSSLHPDLLWEETVPLHWPRMTWEMQQSPVVVEVPRVKRRMPSPVQVAQKIYRRVVPLETRLATDRRIRKLIRRPLPDPEKVQLEKLAARLEAMTTQGVDAGKFAVETALPAVFLFNSVAWNSVVQRQHHFARGLAERGHAVFWIEPALSPLRNWGVSKPLQEVAPGVHVVRLPALARDVYTLDWNESVLEFMLGAMAAALLQTASAYGVREAVALVNYPRWQPLVRRLQERHGWKLAKDCLDDQRAFAGLYQTVLGGFEDWLIAHADLLITSSVVLQERLRPLESVLLHNAADYDLFSSAVPRGYLQDVPRPVVGFFGALADWLDMDLIRAAAERFPAWTFVYIGPHTFSQSTVEVEWLRKTDLPNIRVLPQMDPRTLAAHLAEFEVCTMPFLDIPVTRSMNPVKLYEYLAAGKPTVCRALPEVRHLVESGAEGLIALYTTPKEFFQRLQEAVAEDSVELRARRRAFAKVNDWNDRVDTLSAMIAGLITR